MSAIEELQQLKAAGFADDELGTWAMQRRKELSDAGFGQGEIDTYFGHPPFTPEPLKDHFNTVMEQATAPTTEGGQRKPVTNFWDALKVGFGESVTGLLKDGAPKETIAPDAPMASRIAGQVGTLAGDVPFMLAGAVAGGANPITGTAGAFALPAGMRKILMDKYEKGEVSGWQDFWDRASGAFIDTAKGWITGAATGGAGKLASMAPIVSPTVRAGVVAGSEIATMVTVGKALEGQVPKPQDFIDATVALGFVKGSVKVAKKLRSIYAETGVKPDEVLQDVQKDPTILQDLASQDVEIPTTYRQGKTAEAGAESAPAKTESPEPAKPAAEVAQSGPATIEERKFVQVLRGQRAVPLAAPPEIPLLDGPAEPLSRAEWAQTPRHKMPIDQNAEMLARAEKALADIEMAGDERGGRYFVEQDGHGSTDEVIGLKSATAEWYKEATTGPRKLSRGRIEIALNKILEGKGRDVGSDVLRVKELLLSDQEYDYSPFAPRTEEEWDRARQYAMSEWEPDIAMGGGAPPKTPASKPATPSPQKPERPILDRIVQEETAKPGMTLSDVYTSVIDNLNPIKQSLKQGGKADLPTGKNPYDLQRLTRGTMGKGTEFLKYGAFDFNTYATKTRGYEQILEPVKNDLDGFREYMVAKRVIEKEGQGIETGFDLDYSRDVVKRGASKYEAVHQERLQYRDALLDYLQQSGIVSAKAATAMRDANKDYVPFHRFFEDQVGGSASTSKSVRNPIKRMTGGDEKIYDPILSDIKDTFLFVGLAEKNAARQAFVKLGADYAVKQAPTMQPVRLTEPELRNAFDEFISYRTKTAKTQTETSTTTGGEGEAPQSKQTKMVVQRVREALLARGFQPGEADQMILRVGEAEAGKIGATVEKIIKETETTTYVPELDIRLPNDAATVFRAIQAPLKADEMAVFTNGKREVYQVDPKVAEAFQDLDRISTNYLTDMIVHTPASLLRAGVVVTPDYIGRNILRDAVSSFIYAGANPIKTVKGMASLVTKDTAFHNWMKGGGANATMVSIDRDYIHNHIMDLNLETGLMRRAWNVARTPIDVLRATSEFVENATRLGAVRSDLLKAKDKAAIQALSLIAREATVDFARHGKDTQEMGKMTAFFNPTLQGIDRFAREMKSNPVGMTAKSLAAVTLPSLLLWAANKDDQEIQNLPRWQKDLFWIARIPTGNGESFLLRIPKPQEFGILFGTLPERLMDQFVADNPKAMRDIEKSLMDAFLPNVVPTMAVPMVAQFANRAALTGGPMIPAHLEGLLPEYQYGPYTTELAKAMGQILGAFPGLDTAKTSPDPMLGGTARALTTPLFVENYVRSWTGGMGMYLFQLADKALREAGAVPDPVKPLNTLADLPIIKAFVVRYPSASAQSIQDFYEDTRVSKLYFKTMMHLAESGDPKAGAFMREHQSDLAQLDDMVSAVSQQSQIIRMIHKNPQMTPDEKRQLIDTLYYRMIELSRAGNTILRELKKPRQ